MTRWAWCVKFSRCFVCHMPKPFWYVAFNGDRPVACRHS
jgi:hypothetical protein